MKNLAVAIDFLTNLKENARDTETTRELDRLLQELKRPDAEIPDGKESDKDIDTKISIDLHTAGDLPLMFGPLFKLVNSSIFSLLYYPLALRPNPVV